ncbi:MAG: hypothetical protein ACLP66_03725 [Polyangia bacterium]
MAKKKRTRKLVVSGVKMVVQKRQNRSLEQASLKQKINKTRYGKRKGVFVAGLRTSRRSIPWWVGCTTKQGFGEECASDHTASKIRHALLKSPGTLTVSMIAQDRPVRGRVSKRAVIGLEDGLIAHARKANPKLLNKRRPGEANRRAETSLCLDRGRPTKDERYFLNMFKPKGRK